MSETVHVIKASMGLFDAALRSAAWRETLSSEEQARAARAVDVGVRAHHIAGRLLLRQTLARVIGDDPASIRIEISAHGRPEATDHPGLSFSLSHAADTLAMAWSRDARVGIDLEESGRSLDPDPMARLVLSPREAALYAAAADRKAAFLRFWTAKEAVAKAHGQGLRVDPRGFGLLGGLPEPNGPSAPARDIDGALWWVSWVAAPGAVCHVASSGTDVEVAVSTFAVAP